MRDLNNEYCPCCNGQYLHIIRLSSDTDMVACERCGWNDRDDNRDDCDRPADVEAAVTALSSAPAIVEAAKILEQRTTNTCDACGDSTANAVYCDDCLAEQTSHALQMLYEDSLDFELDDDGEEN